MHRVVDPFPRDVAYQQWCLAAEPLGRTGHCMDGEGMERHLGVKEKGQCSKRLIIRIEENLVIHH